MSDSPGPLEFFDQLRRLIRQERDKSTASEEPINSAAERLILNRAAVSLVCQALGDGTPDGAAQLPAVVLLGQPGHVGYIEACPLYYDPKLDRDSEPLAKYVVRTSGETPAP